MDRRKVVDQWAELDTEIKKLSRQRDALAKQLTGYPSGTELDGYEHRVRVRDRAVLQAEKLRERLSVAMWTRITKRVPVADLYKAEVRRGKLSQDLFKECSTRSEQWLETI